MKQQKANKKRSIFDNKRVSGIFAVLLAVLAWVIIAGFINPGEETDIDRVPINYTINEAQYKNQDLMIVSETEQYSKVTVSGYGNTVWNMTSADVLVYPNYTQVTGPGEWELPLLGEKNTGGNYDVTIKSPKTVTLRFERMVTRTFTVTANADMVEAATGFFRDTPTAAPTTVEVTGPESVMDKVVQAVAIVHETAVRDKTIYYPRVEIQLLDAENQEINDELITITPSDVEVAVPILEVRSIPITVDIIGAPSNFDTEWFKSLMTLSEDTIRMAGEPELLNNLTEYNVGAIDLSTFELSSTETGYSYPPFNITLPERIKNYDQLKQVTVSFDTTGLAQKTFNNIPNINVINIHGGMTVEPVDGTVSNVTLIGPQEVLDGLLPENIQIEIDAFGTSVAQGGQQSFVGRVQVPSSDRVFAMGNPEIICDVEVA